ncbi:MAG: hypothetical protein ACLFWB_13925, partial [Armatimonadota bacterium]
MHRWLIVVAPLVLLAAVCGAQDLSDNLLVNPDFDTGLEGWSASREGEPEWSAKEGSPQPGSLTLSGQRQLEGAIQEVTLDDPANFLYFSGMCRCERVDGDKPLVGLDLGIVLDNDEIVWFVPPSAELSKGSEDWQQLSGRYIADEGRTIKQVRFFCLNYRNGTPASFDTLSLQAAQVKTTAARVTILTPGTPEGMQRQELLAEAAGSVCEEVAVSPRVPNADDAEVLILPEWQDSDRLLEDVKTFAYCGGKVLCGWLPDRGTGLALWYWLFEGVGDTMSMGRQNTAAGWPEEYSPSTEEIAGAVEALLAAEWSWPDAPEIEQSWPDAPQVSFDEHGVRVGGEYRLLFAAGAYRVTEDADSGSDMRHFADLGMNATVLYLHESEPLERLLAALDAAHDQGIVCLLYLQGGRGTHHPGRPWRAEWIAKFSPAAQHPAFLGWLTGDDTHSRHRDMMLRTHEIIRHYDTRGLVTMTLLDLRRPQD